jgi:signal transduction histidine kinase
MGAGFAAFNAANSAGPANILINLAISALALVFLRHANSLRPGAHQRFKRYSLITVAVVFVGAFPVLFFTAGGYHSGMPSFFVFAVAFTVFMLEGRKRLFVVGFEILLYLAICLIAYYFPETLSAFPSQESTARDIISGAIFSSAALGLATSRHITVYDREQKRLEAFDRQKTELLGNISHELKLPLAVVSLQAQSLRDKLEKLPEAKEAVSAALIIAAEAQRMSLMVGQVLLMTRIEEGCLIWNRQPCHIDEIIYSAIQTHFPILNQADNRLEIKTEDNLPLVLADAQRVTQVIVNLISNAARHTEGGMITVSARRTDAGVAVAVQDTGEGIAPDDLPFVFDRYHTGGGTRDTGTGLGLYICKQIVEAHGGEITVLSDAGKGTLAAFTLPVCLNTVS